jgi:hypothetical protein
MNNKGRKLVSIYRYYAYVSFIGFCKIRRILSSTFQYFVEMAKVSFDATSLAYKEIILATYRQICLLLSVTILKSW